MWPFRKRPDEEQRAIEAWPWDTGGPPSYINSMGVDRALSLVPVFGAARLLGDSIASLTPVLYRAGANGIPQVQPPPSLLTQPSVHGTLGDWLFRAVVSLALQGDAIGMITARDYMGYPTMIEWLSPQEVATEDGANGGQGSFMDPLWFWRGRRLNREDIIHIPWFSMPYRVRGLSPIGAFKMTATTGLGAEEYAAQWFTNGGVPPGTFQNSEQKVSKEDADIIEARVTARLQRRRPLVYGKDWTYNPIAIKPNEAQFVETMRLTATQIAVIYGVPPEKIGGTTGSTLTYTTAEMNTIDYVTFSLRPWLVRFERALSTLFPRGQYVKFDTNEMLRSDAKTRAEIDVMSLGTTNPVGWRTRNEVRADRDLPPLPDPPVPAAPPQPLTNGAKPATNGAQPAMVRGN